MSRASITPQGAGLRKIICGHGLTVMALLRDAVVSLLHRAGVRQISARLRDHSQHLSAAVALLLATSSTRA